MSVQAGATGNVAVGKDAGNALTTGVNNVAIGLDALGAETTGTSNVAIGKDALLAQAGAIGNVAIGTAAGDALTTGANNVAVGLNALSAATTGALNTAIGKDALLVATIAVNNTAIGALSLTGATTGVDNTACGYNALAAVTTGVQNTAIGSGAGATITTGTNNTLIGYGAAASGVGTTNEITLGNTSVTIIRAQVTTITAISDGRDKTNIEDLDLGLDFITKLRPRKYEWNMRDGTPMSKGTQIGFIAQDSTRLSRPATPNGWGRCSRPIQTGSRPTAARSSPPWSRPSRSSPPKCGAGGTARRLIRRRSTVKAPASIVGSGRFC